MWNSKSGFAGVLHNKSGGSVEYRKRIWWAAVAAQHYYSLAVIYTRLMQY
jgi:hypothetical protein